MSADSRDADLKDVVLDQLFAQHDDAELDAELDEAASWCTLGQTHTCVRQQQQTVRLSPPKREEKRRSPGGRQTSSIR